ncbi:MAG: thiol-disulfide oxidoreductase DCC family protein [Bacteroidetes bacterium]|nr:thiol-disulfide oxidoreductase DCC family protein [Bacteroidota bacterium]
MEHHENLLLFDGVCNLCNHTVQFIIKRDKGAKFKFAALQSDIGQALLKKYDLPLKDFESFVLIRKGNYYQRSSAALQVAKVLGWPWRLFYIFILIPKFIRDFFYNIISNSRYNVFGRQDSCMIPSPELKERFL